MSVVGSRRAREMARLQAGGWTVVTYTPWQRLLAAWQDRPGRGRQSSPAVSPARGWAR